MIEIDPLKKEKVAQYLENCVILIADPNSSSRVRLAGSLVELGAKRPKIQMVSSFDEAEIEIRKSQPTLILSDYTLGSASGIDLIEIQREIFPDAAKRIFCLVTGNTAQSAVAEAAEEDVDAYVLKPYRPDQLKSTLVSTIYAKLFPSPYILKVEMGKKLLFGGAVAQSIPVFDEAMKLDMKPTLACYYRGQAQTLLQALANADSDYKKGLSYNRIHYKCLVGLFDLLLGQTRKDQAYDIVKQIAQYFPANPNRLKQVLGLAIETRNFGDVADYYSVFTKLDRRTPVLTNTVCSAMSVTGKFFLKQGDVPVALDHFEKAAISSAGKTSIIRYLVETLVKFGELGNAEKYMARFPAESRKQADFLFADYLILSKKGDQNQLIQKGRQILKEGIQDPAIYSILIQSLRASGNDDNAEQLLASAQQLWPEFNSNRFASA